MLLVRILGTGSVARGRHLRTEDLVGEAMPGRDPAGIIARTGIRRRYWIDDDDDATSLGADALSLAPDRAGMTPDALWRLVFVSSTSGDRLIPATANSVAARVGMPDDRGCFDVNNACTGMLTALDLAFRQVGTGEGPAGTSTIGSSVPASTAASLAFL